MHCAEPSNDGIVYVCDRTNDRLQVFTLEGKFVNEIQVHAGIAEATDRRGTSTSRRTRRRSTCIWPTAAIRSIHIYDRKSMVELTNFGTGGHYPGQWYSLHSIAVDSKGNLYTTETYQGRRVQKFTYKGLAPVTQEGTGRGLADEHGTVGAQATGWRGRRGRKRKTSCPFCFFSMLLSPAAILPFPPLPASPASHRPEKTYTLPAQVSWRRRMKGRRFVKLGAAALALVISSRRRVRRCCRRTWPRKDGEDRRLDSKSIRCGRSRFRSKSTGRSGSVTGVAVDAQDHIWVSNRGDDSLQNNEKGPTLTPWASECCFGAPQMLEFDAAGTLLNSWGGPGQGYHVAAESGRDHGRRAKATSGLRPAAIPRRQPDADADRHRRQRPRRLRRGAAAGAGRGARRGGGTGWRRGAGGCRSAGSARRAPRGSRWSGRRARDQVRARRKVPPADWHARQDGRRRQPDTLNGPQAVAVDDAANEVYVADSGNKRVVVFDANTGAYKRHWTAAGSKPFADVSCVRLAKDGMVYVCDSANNRIVRCSRRTASS